MVPAMTCGTQRKQIVQFVRAAVTLVDEVVRVKAVPIATVAALPPVPSIYGGGDLRS